MSWTDDWWPNTLDAVGTLRGTGAAMQGGPGAPMPLLRAIDTIGIMGQFSPSVCNAIATMMSSTNNLAAQVCIQSGTDGLGDDGFTDTGFFSNALAIPIAIQKGVTIQQYVAGHGIQGAEYKRWVSDYRVTYEPWGLHSVLAGDEGAYMRQIREMVAAWSRLIDASVNAIRVCSTDLTQTIPSDELSEFWLATLSMCSNLDVLAENVPMGYGDKVKQATLAGIHASEKFVGEAAAGLTNELGKAAANVTKGFFSEAGILALVVAGIAVFLFVR